MKSNKMILFIGLKSRFVEVFHLNKKAEISKKEI